MPLREPRFIILGAAARSWSCCSPGTGSPQRCGTSRAEAAAGVAVDVARVRRADVPVYLEGLGTVQAFYTVTVTARVDGQIDKVAFTEGQDVKKGDAAGADRSAALPGGARRGDRHARQGQGTAGERAARHGPLRGCSRPRTWRASRPSTRRSALIAQLAAQVKGDEAAIDNARTQLDYTTITSPIDGRTGIRLVDPGNIVHATDTTGMVVVTQLEPISVIFSLPEEQFAQLSDALQRGAVTATALSRDDKEELDQRHAWS